MNRKTEVNKGEKTKQKTLLPRIVVPANKKCMLAVLMNALKGSF